MNPKATNRISERALDSILAAEEEILPSSGFLASVMESVTEAAEAEAAAPPPIPFPWRRAIPAIVLATAVFGWGGYELVRLSFSAASGLQAPSIHLSAALQAELAGLAKPAIWVAVSLAASLLCWLLSRRLVGRSALM